MPPYLSSSDSDGSETEQAMIKPRVTSRSNSASGRTNGVTIAEKKKRISPGDASEDNEIAEETEDDGDDDDDGEEAEDEDAEEYIVEKILAHEWVAAEKRYKYETKWLGWDDVEDHTWEPKANLQGAIETLREYFDSIGGEPQPPGSSAKGPKKRGRQSTGSTTIDTPKKPKTSGVRGRPKRSTLSALEDPSAWGPGASGSWSPPSPGKDAWEDMVIQVETIEPDTDGNKWAFVQWAELDDAGRNRKTKERLHAVYVCAPQKMLAFYEKHLVFGSNSKDLMSDS